MTISITLVLVVTLLILGMVSGFKKGLVKSVTSLIFTMATVIMLSLGLYIYHNYEMHNGLRVLIAVLCLTVFGAAFGLLRLVLKALKLIVNLPLIKLLDHVAGAIAGIVIAVLLVELLYVAGFYNLIGRFSSILIEDIRNNEILFSLFKYNIFLK